LWRAVAVSRIVTLCYAAVVILGYDSRYAHPAGGILALAAMTAWTVFTIIAYSRPRWRQPWLIVIDVAVATGLIVSARWTGTTAALPLRAGDPIERLTAAVGKHGRRTGAAAGRRRRRRVRGAAHPGSAIGSREAPSSLVAKTAPQSRRRPSGSLGFSLG
jgi:Family of unknown function (DUF5931)